MVQELQDYYKLKMHQPIILIVIFYLIQLSNDLKKTSLNTIDNKDKLKRLKGKFNSKKKGFSNFKDKTDAGKWYNSIIKNSKQNNK